jgi:hypothetical protein
LNENQQPHLGSGNLGVSRSIGIEPSKFSDKIPSKKSLMDFFENHLGLYTPPEREMTTLFAKQVLSGEKLLLK